MHVNLSLSDILPKKNDNLFNYVISRFLLIVIISSLYYLKKIYARFNKISIS